jgi:hypothetical protein
LSSLTPRLIGATIPYILKVVKESSRVAGGPLEEAFDCAQRGSGWGAESQRMVWNLPDKQRKLGMVLAEGTVCPKACRYTRKVIFGELWIVWHDLAIILENGKRRAGKVHRNNIIMSLVMRVKKSRSYFMARERAKGFYGRHCYG